MCLLKEGFILQVKIVFWYLSVSYPSYRKFVYRNYMWSLVELGISSFGC